MIILASKSPRRRELLEKLGLDFTVMTEDVDETMDPALPLEREILRVSEAKARAVQAGPDDLIISADTVVCVDGRRLGKPADEADAKAMLRALSGKTHQVYTAVTLAQKGREPETFVDCTDVTFGDLTDEEIAHYVHTYRPLDKAGAYGVQEWIGYVACIGMKGSYFNVMGFPVHLVYQALKKRGF